MFTWVHTWFTADLGRRVGSGTLAAVSFIDRIVEQQIQAAMARGEFDDLPGAGKPLDLDPREPGWWAEQFVRRERSRLLREEVVHDLAVRRAAFWRAGSIDELRELVTETNKVLTKANARMSSEDGLPLVDYGETVERWREVAGRS